jgi:predicted Fe-Mo cluster-binding NifX family protein
MKIGISSIGEDLNSQVDRRFGRCRYFLIVNTENMSFESISNDSAMASGGAGIQAAQTVAKAGVKAIITGNVGPNAFQTLSVAGIKVFTGEFRSVREAVEKYKKGELVEIEGASVNSHFGMKRTNRDFVGVRKK